MQQHDRRSGPRRTGHAEYSADGQVGRTPKDGPAPGERRRTERRRRNPGLAALFGAILGVRHEPGERP